MTDARPLIYLTSGEVVTFNEEILRQAGQGHSILRDRGLLESAMLRPQNAAYYEGADAITQAALYMVGISLNHPFLDGNKRTGYLAGVTFLLVNGVIDSVVILNDIETGMWLESVVKRTLTFETFVERLRDRLTSS